MLKKGIVRSLIGLGAAQMLSFSLLAQENGLQCCDTHVIVGNPLDSCCIDPIYPYPATITPCDSWDIFAKGEFLYFSSNVDNYVNTGSEIAFDLSELNYKFQKAPYRPGFRVAVGANLESAVLEMTYLRYHPHTTTHFNSQDGRGIVVNYNAGLILTPAFGQPRLFFQSVDSSLHLDLDYAIISIHKPVYFSQRIILNLNYGVLGLWTSQVYKFTCTALNPPPPVNAGLTSNGVSRASHKTWAVGPKLGFHAVGLLPCRFKALLEIDLSLMYGSCYHAFSTGFFPQALFPLANATVEQKEHSSHLQAFHNGLIGIGWGNYFFCDRYHLDLYVTYNFLFQHIFNYSVALTPVGFDGMNLSNYSVHGFAIGGRIDF
ncbi:MAG: hypothetical protein JSS30_02400 [Verrucomicrobia bacterium]|nr:hypothetical protein [Verrucomicrobiota bacterium]